MQLNDDTIVKIWYWSRMLAQCYITDAVWAHNCYCISTHWSFGVTLIPSPHFCGTLWDSRGIFAWKRKVASSYGNMPQFWLSYYCILSCEKQEKKHSILQKYLEWCFFFLLWHHSILIKKMKLSSLWKKNRV